MASGGITQPAKWHVGPPAPAYFGWIARALMLLLIITIGHWVRVCLGGVASRPVDDGRGGNDTSRLFNWHPVLMTLAFGVFMAEAVLTYQAPVVPTLPRPTRKKVHYILHSLALLCACLGVWVAFQSHNLKLPTPIPNLYSPHSVLGLTTLTLAALQFLGGLGCYLWPQASLPTKLALSPVHKFGGKLVWVCGLAAMATGLQEKTTFVQAGRALGGDALYSAVVRLPAMAQLLLVLLGGFVLFHHVPAAKPVEEDREARQGLLSTPTPDA